MSDITWRPTLLIRATLLLHALALIVVIADPLQWRRVLFAVLANHALLMLTGLWPRSHWLGPNWTRLPLAAADRREIALTIDDGPDPVVTPQVLDMLDRYHVRATFFCIGEKAAHYPDLCREIVRRGHTIENHSQHHRHHFSIMGRAAMMHELQTAQHTLTAITGKPPLFFRAPAGLRNPFLDPVLTKLDLRLASWSARGFDTRVNDAARVTNRLLRNLRAGAILLLHDGNAARTPGGIPVILDVLPTLLTAARAADLRFVTLRAALL
jgi:peptidoglycan/xylan/chitin deacetylase (PgdA/CDA1 family)